MAIPDCITDIPLTKTRRGYTKKTRIALFERGYAPCSMCSEILPVRSFRIDIRATTGLRSACLECERKDEQHRRKIGKKRGGGKPKRRYSSVPRVPKVRPAVVAAPANAGIYVLQMGDIYKIGRSRNIHRRMTELCGMLPYHTELVCTIPGSVASLYALEALIHERFRESRLNGEWFKLTGDQLAYVQSLGQ